MARFPFVVSRRKAVVIEAPSLPNALDRVLLKFEGKWIKVNYARNVHKHLKTMDLINANKEASKLSKLKKKELVYVVLEDDEFKVTQDVDIDKDDIYSTWRGGVKIDAPEGKKAEPETKSAPTAKSVKRADDNVAEQTITNKEMKTKARKPVAKKAAAKKSNGTKVRALDAPIKGGATLLILQALKKKIHTKAELAKVGKTKETNISWYLNKIKNNGHNVVLTDKGYSLK